MNDKATDRLLRDIERTRYDTRSAAFEALRTLPGIRSIEIRHTERTVFYSHDTESVLSWSVSATHADMKSRTHTAHGMSLHNCVCLVLESYRLDPLGTINVTGLNVEDVIDPHSHN